MNLLAVFFLVVASGALLLIPRRWAPLPLLAGACYMTLGQSIEIGGFNFFLLRFLLLAGFLRALVRGERPAGGILGMDWLMLAWAGWALICSTFREDPGKTLVFHLGMIYNTLGVYFLVRCFCRDQEDVIGLVKMTALLLVPVALEMLQEQFSGRNLFAVLGGVPEETVARSGRLRSQGPFRHAILAGTAGAVCAPLMVGIWRRHPRIAKIGLAACLLMVITSASSGPLLSLIFAGGAVMFWRWRHFTRYLWLLAVVSYVLLEIVMNAPAYYLVARVDIAGGSTGFHRARLIEAAVEHLDEWWAVGSDYTRHWIPYAPTENHVDITNQYLVHGVRGGLPLMALFMLTIWLGFRYVRGALANHFGANIALGDQFLIWTVGSALFAHAVTCLSVSYFDQSFLFLYLNLGIIASLHGALREQPAVASVTSEAPIQDWELFEGWELPPDGSHATTRASLGAFQ